MTEYIKREDVIALAWDVTYKDEWYMHKHDKVVSVSDIAEIPSADVVERKTGKWEKYDDGIMVYWLCSKCNEYVWYNEEELTLYCPNCGADMRGREDERTD